MWWWANRIGLAFTRADRPRLWCCRFQMEPIAAASLGQVHLARLNGRRVVVKVQRPFLREIFDVDLKNIRVLAQIFQALDPQSDGAARDWVAIYDECSRILYQVSRLR